MSERNNAAHSVQTIKDSLKRLEKQLKSPHVRPADFATRDRLARRLRDAMDAQKTVS
jgi:hypothetical protein